MPPDSKSFEDWSAANDSVLSRIRRRFSREENVSDCDRSLTAVRRHTDGAIITLNKRDPTLADAYRVDLATGRLELAAENPGNFLGYVADRQNRVRAAYSVNSTGHYQLFARASESAQ